jgi:hypothetical protein
VHTSKTSPFVYAPLEQQKIMAVPEVEPKSEAAKVCSRRWHDDDATAVWPHVEASRGVFNSRFPESSSPAADCPPSHH